jgi:hypothetical protein
MRLRAMRMRQALIFSAAMLSFFCQPVSAAPTCADCPDEWEEAMEHRARGGDVEAMAQLLVHYSLHVENDEKSFYWMLRLADAGESAERGAVLGRFCGSSSAEDRAVGLFLADKWGRREDCASARALRRCTAGNDGTSPSVRSEAAKSCRDGGD